MYKQESARRVEAIIRPEMLEPLRQQLQTVDYPGMTVTEVEGHGRQRGVEQQWRGTKFKTYFLPKLKVELVVPAKQVKTIVDIVLAVCGQGTTGDGKIFVSAIEQVITVRTKQVGLKIAA